MLLAADRLDFLNECWALLEHRMTLDRFNQLVYPKTLTDPIIKEIITLGQAIALSNIYPESTKWTTELNKKSRGGRYPGYYYYVAVFALGANLMEASVAPIPDDALAYYIDHHKQEILLKPVVDMNSASRDYASNDKPLALRALTSIVNIGQLPLNTSISSADVARVLYENHLFNFDVH